MRVIARIIKLFVVLNLVGAAIGFVLKQIVRPEGGEESDDFTLPTFMFGNTFTSRASSLRHGSIITYMGGLELDLTEATPSPNARLTVLTVAGGVEIRVPAHWRVSVTNELFGGDARVELDGQEALPETAPTLVIDARTVLGGFLVTNRPRRAAAPTP